MNSDTTSQETVDAANAARRRMFPETGPSLHPTTFGFLQPTPSQIEAMNDLREASRLYAECIDAAVPNGPDKTYILRRIRETAMWINISITRHADGSPRIVPDDERTSD